MTDFNRFKKEHFQNAEVSKEYYKKPDIKNQTIGPAPQPIN